MPQISSKKGTILDLKVRHLNHYTTPFPLFYIIIGINTLKIMNILLPEWFTNWAHAQYYMEIGSHTLNQECKYALR